MLDVTVRADVLCDEVVRLAVRVLWVALTLLDEEDFAELSCRVEAFAAVLDVVLAAVLEVVFDDVFAALPCTDKPLLDWPVDELILCCEDVNDLTLPAADEPDALRTEPFETDFETLRLPMLPAWPAFELRVSRPALLFDVELAIRVTVREVRCD